MEQGNDFFCSVSQYLSFHPVPSIEPSGRRSGMNAKVYTMGEDMCRKLAAMVPTWIPVDPRFMVLGRLSEQRPRKLV